MVHYDNYSYNVPYGSGKTNFAYYLKIVALKLQFIILIFISLVLLHLSLHSNKNISRLKDFVNVVSKPSFFVVNKFYKGVYNTFSFINELAVLKKNNLLLKQDNERMQFKLIEAKHLENENADLRDIVNFISFNQVDDFITVKPIYVIKDRFSQKLKVEKDSDVVLSEGDIAFDSKGYFIGRVINITDKNAEILLITDKSSRIPAIISSNKTKVILSGTNTNYLEIVNFFGNKLEMKEGDLLFTINDGKIIDDNFFIGKIVKEDNKLKIKVNDNINYLDLVFIIHKK